MTADGWKSQGSEDSHGRTLWALAECARADTDPSRRAWAAALFKTALPAVETFTSPRAWAFSLLGLDAYCGLDAGDHFASGMRKTLADRLMALFHASQREDWLWFEDVLAYDNARLSQALIETGIATDTPSLRRDRAQVAALAHVAANHVIRALQARGFGKLRQDSPRAGSVRPATGRGGRRHFCVSCRVARGRRRGVAAGRDARIRVVSGRKRPADGVDRSRHGELFGWSPPGPDQ